MNRSLHIRVAVAFLAAAFLLVALPTPARAGDVSIQATPSFTFTGSGWGHGIGMSQYGAQGYALTGWAYDRIIKHYYQGTSIAGAKSLSVRVYIDKDAAPRASWTVRAVGAPLTVYSDSQSISLAANTYYTFKNSSSGVTVSSYPAGSVLATFGGNTTADPEGAALLEVRDTSGPAIHESYPNGYPGVRWRGVVQFVRSSTTALHAVNVLNIEQYLYGVVPRESPSSWHAQALRAQAVAARSYAKRKVDPNDDGVLDAHLRCTTADQVYAGHSRYVEDSGLVVSHEAASTNAAVDATKDQVVKYGSTIVMTYFSSSMGGHTANIEDSWGYSTPQPYYTGVPSPYEALAGCPNQYWAVSLTGLKTAELLSASSTVRSELSTHGLTPVPVGAGTSVWVSGIRVEYGVSGYPRWVYFTFSSGDIVKLTSYTVRGALGLKSPHFTPSGFPIMRIEGPNRYATAAAVSQAAFSSTAPAVVLASGEDYADALSGSALAGATSGALLLTARDSLPLATSVELSRLAPKAVYVLGGESAVSAEVERAVRTLLPSASIERIAGADRYETAYLAAEEVYALAPGNTAIVVSGKAWADAASASAVAYGQKAPILLTAPDVLSEEAEQYLSERRPSIILVVGGEAVLSSDIDVRIRSITGRIATRLAGANRYETSAAVARWAIGFPAYFTYDEVYMATGATFADALTGGSLAGVKRKPLLLTAADYCPSGTAAFLTERKLGIGQIYLFGGEAAISERGRDAIDAVMMQ